MTRFQGFGKRNGLVGGNRGALLGLAEAGMGRNIGGLRRDGRKADQEEEGSLGKTGMEGGLTARR